MGKIFDANALRATTAGTPTTTDKPKATFLADTLEIVVRSKLTGEVVLECDVEPRGFGAKEVTSGPNKGKMMGGVGWYGDVRADNCGTYQDFPVSAGLRLSLDGIKIPPSDTIDLRSEKDDGDEGDAS